MDLIESLLTLPSLDKFIQAIGIACGLYLNIKLYRMVVIEWKYGKGEEYLRGEYSNATQFKRKKE